MVRFADGGERVPASLPEWLQWQAHWHGCSPPRGSACGLGR